MASDQQVREALERNVKVITRRPAVGQGTARTRARLQPGLACEVTDGGHAFTVGMTEKYGGADAGPNPGVFGRGALASCLAIGYAMWAARLGVEIDSLTVEVEADYDVRGELGIEDDVRPGYLAMRYTVSVESSADEADVLRVLDTADRCSSWRDIIANGVPLERTATMSVPSED